MLPTGKHIPDQHVMKVGKWLNQKLREEKYRRFRRIRIPYTNQPQKHPSKHHCACTSSRRSQEMECCTPYITVHLLPLVGARGIWLGINTALKEVLEPWTINELKGAMKSDRIAASKTFFRPFWVRAEHSRYLRSETWATLAKAYRNRTKKGRISYCIAFISFARCIPWGYDIADIFFAWSCSVVFLSSRRSSFVPTRMIGISGAWWDISGYHWITDFVSRLWYD